MNAKISSLQSQVDDLKIRLDTKKIRDRIRNLINSFCYILSEEDLKDLESKRIKRSDIFSNAFEQKFFQYKNNNKYHTVKNLLIKACDLYDFGNINAFTLYSKSYREKKDEFVNLNNIKNIFISDDKILFLSLCDISKDYIEYSIDFVQNCLGNNFSKIFLSSGVDIYDNFFKS